MTMFFFLLLNRGPDGNRIGITAARPQSFICGKISDFYNKEKHLKLKKHKIHLIKWSSAHIELN